MQLAICDDDEKIRRSVALRLGKRYPDIDVHSFASAEDLIKSEICFAIYLLDIEMRGMSGMELAERIRKHPHPYPPIIIFITGFPDHMADAFDVQAYHYLLKPIDDQKFIEVMDRAVREINTLKSQIDDYLIIKSGSIIHKVAYDDIIYIESSNKHSIFHTTDGSIKSYTHMNELEDTLTGRFFRCHRGYLVNLAHVITYEVGGITVTGGDSILLSRLKYQDFVQAFMNYARSGGIVRV